MDIWKQIFGWPQTDVSKGPLHREDKSRTSPFFHLSVSCVAVLFVLGLTQLELDGLKGILVDGLFRLHLKLNANPDIVLIAYDDESASQYSPSTHIPVEELQKVFHFLAQARPKSVGIIGSFSEKNYTDAELEKLAASFASVPDTIVGYVDDDSLGKPAPSAFYGKVRYLPGFISRDTISYGADSVSRRVMVSVEGYPTVYAEMARLFRGMGPDAAFSHTHPYGVSGNSYQTYINWQGPPGTYAPFSSRTVHSGKISPEVFRGKMVLFSSTLTSRKTSDLLLTPYSREPSKTHFIEAAAQSLSTLMKDDGLFKPPEWINLVLSLFIGIATVNMVLYLSPGKGIAFVVATLVALLGCGWIALFHFDCWLNIAHPLVVAGVGYYLVIPYRLVDEYRKRWHYQEKSELMTQLELLKSNFLSLISHDLKTPIARIHGNAELVLNEGELTDKQRKSLSAIVHTTEDLGDYVEAILDLTRIESAQMPLQKVSKDINSTILEAVESKRFLALEKDIDIRTQLEPLFSVKFDVKLIRRVIANIVENAIKYSPPNTHIVVQSREENNWIKVSVADEGQGISENDQKKVFEKFFRCDNSREQATKGTGLGLYLVKYFVELHEGMVELKSELGKGSVFTISLPV